MGDHPDERVIDERIQAALRQLPPMPVVSARERTADLLDRIGADDDIYVCPDHERTGGYESCCSCGGWTADDPNGGRTCTEAD